MNAGARVKRALFSGVLVILLSACSLVQFAYYQLDWLIPYELETYVDLSDSQRSYLDMELVSILEWHCSAHLPQYAALITEANAAIQSRSVDRATLDAYSLRIRAFWFEIIEESLPTITDLLFSASDEQIDNMFTVFDEENEEWLERFREKADAEIRDDYVTNMTQELERWVGPLEPSQEEAVRAWSLEFKPLGMDGLAMRKRWQSRLRALFETRSNAKVLFANVKILLLEPDPDRSESLNRHLAHNHDITVNLVYETVADLSDAQHRHLTEFSRTLAADLNGIDCSF